MYFRRSEELLPLILGTTIPLKLTSAITVAFNGEVAAVVPYLDVTKYASVTVTV